MQGPCALYPAFLLFWLLVVQKRPWGFWSFCSSSMTGPICTQARLLVLLVPRGLFVFCFWSRRVSTCTHCSRGSVPGPRVQSLASP